MQIIVVSRTLQISTSERVKYIHSLCRHISRAELRVLGLLEMLRLMSRAPRRPTLVIRIMSLKRKRQRSFLIQM